VPEAPTRIPKPRPGSDPRELTTLDDVERTIFPRVDGSRTEAELALLCGLDEETTRQAVGRLALRGLVDLTDQPPPLASETRRAAAPMAPSPPPPPAAEIDLEPALRDRIDAAFKSLDELDHYALLGVTREADRKAVKSAYYDAASAFHPDRYFRKRLGPFKPKMEAIFSRVTLAHDVLTDRDTRLEYDAYLRDRLTSRGIEDLLREGIAEIAAAEAAVEEAASSNDFNDPPEPPPPPPVAPPPTSSGQMRAVTPLSPAATQARRDMLARRLLGGRATTTRSSPTVPAARPAQSSGVDAAVESLRRRYEQRVQQARSYQASKYAETASSAVAKGDFVAAANAYRVAVGMAPGDLELKTKYELAQKKSDEMLSESYTRQAGYEEKMGNFAAAALSWTKVTNARPNEAECHGRAAAAMLKASGDLHLAARFAQRAVAIDPESIVYRVTLANVYIAAGLSLNARRELEAAAQLAPADDTIRSLLKKVSKS
jgi:curved DNA-binding protein CbpA